MRQGHSSLFILWVEEALPPPLALPLKAPLQEAEAWRPRLVEVYCLQEVEGGLPQPQLVWRRTMPLMC